MGCETVNESSVDPLLAGVGGVVAVIVGLLIGFITTKLCFVDCIFEKFFSRPQGRSNAEERSPSDRPATRPPASVDDRKWKVNWKKARVEKDETTSTTVISRHDNTVGEDEMLANEDFDKELYTDKVAGVVDAMLEGASLDVALKQLLRQTLARIHMLFHDSWQYRHLATLQVFRVVLSHYYSLHRIDGTSYSSILGKLQQKLDSSLDASRFSLRKLEVEMRKVLEDEQGEMQDIHYPQVLQGISLLIDEYVKGYDELRRSLSDNHHPPPPTTTNNSADQLAQILTTSLQLIEEQIDEFQAAELQEIAVCYDAKCNQVTAYFGSTDRLTNEHRVEQQVVGAAIRELAEVAEMTDSEEDEVVEEYELRSRELYTRTMQELSDALKEIGSREREARALVHKTTEEEKRRKLQQILDQKFDASTTRDGLEIEVCIKTFFELVTEIQRKSTVKSRSVDSEMKSMCTTLLKSVHERFNSRQHDERQRCIERVTGSETRGAWTKLMRQLASNIKQAKATAARSQSLLAEARSHDQLQDRWRRRLLGNGDDVTAHTLIVSKLMSNEEDDMEAFVTSQVYLPERSRAHVLDQHRTMATVVNNNQSIVTSLCLMACDSYLTCKQIDALRRVGGGYQQQQHGGKEQTNSSSELSSDKHLKKVAKLLGGVRREHEEKLGDFYQFAIHGVWKGTTNLRQTITSLVIVEKAFEALSHFMTSSNNETRCIDAIKVALLDHLQSSSDVEDHVKKEDRWMSQMMEEHREAIRMLDQRMRRDLDHQIKICREGRETRQQLYEDQIFRREEELFRSMMTSSPAARSVSPGGGGGSSVGADQQRFSVGDLLDSLLEKAKNDRATERRKLENESQMSIAIYQLKLQHTQQLNNHIRELDKYLLCKVADMNGISKAQFLRFVKQVLISDNNETRLVKKIASDFSRVWSRSFGAGKKKRRRDVVHPSSTTTPQRFTRNRIAAGGGGDVTRDNIGELPAPRKRGGSFLRRLKNPPLQPVIA